MNSSPFSFEVLGVVQNVVERTPYFIRASDGIDLAYYAFVPDSPHAVLVFYHGGGAWSNALYQYMAFQLANTYNIAVYLFDIRGHGNSHGPRGDAPTTVQVWQDISLAIDFVAKKHPSCPLFLGGHSSGAGLVLNYTDFIINPAVQGYILLAPFLGPHSNTSYEHIDPQKRFIKHVRMLPMMLSMITKGWVCAHSPVIFFNYPENEKKKDLHLLDHYTSAMAFATTPYNAHVLLTRLTRPVLLCIGGCDEQFIPDRIVAVCVAAQKTNTVSLECVVIKQATHLSIVVDAITAIAQYVDGLCSGSI